MNDGMNLPWRIEKHDGYDTVVDATGMLICEPGYMREEVARFIVEVVNSKQVK